MNMQNRSIFWILIFKEKISASAQKSTNNFQCLKRAHWKQYNRLQAMIWLWGGMECEYYIPPFPWSVIKSQLMYWQQCGEEIMIAIATTFIYQGKPWVRDIFFNQLINFHSVRQAFGQGLCSFTWSSFICERLWTKACRYWTSTSSGEHWVSYIGLVQWWNVI